MSTSSDPLQNHNPAHKRVKRRSRLWRSLNVTLASALLICLAAALLAPGLHQYCGISQQSQQNECLNNLKQIGLALHNYLAAYGTFPPAYTVDENGRPMHSWRAILLPSFEGGLDVEYDFAEPWDNPKNLRLIDQTPSVYRCPSDTDAPSGMTNYVAVLGNETFWPYTTGRKANEVSDGLSDTIAVVEVRGLNIPWTKPAGDLEFDKVPFEINPTSAAGIASRHGEGVDMLMADGSVRFMQKKIDPTLLRALLTVAGGEQIPPP